VILPIFYRDFLTALAIAGNNHVAVCSVNQSYPRLFQGLSSQGQGQGQGLTSLYISVVGWSVTPIHEKSNISLILILMPVLISGFTMVNYRDL